MDTQLIEKEWRNMLKPWTQRCPGPKLTLNAGKMQTEKTQMSVGGQTSDFKGLATGTLAGFVDVDYN